MIKVPARNRRTIENELKKFIPIFSNLAAKGKASSEDDARIILNDVLSYVLGYDKYNELRTEQREKQGRLDYLVTIYDDSKKRKAQADFVIEAKAAHVPLNQTHVNQTLGYCLSAGLDYFFLTNVLHWQLYEVKRSRKQSEARLIHEVKFGDDMNADSLAEDFYVFSKASYLAKDWGTISNQVKATNESDILAIILSDRMIRRITKQIEDIHGSKVSESMVKETIETKIVKAECIEVNKSLLRKLNAKPGRETTASQEKGNASPEAEVGVVAGEAVTAEVAGEGVEKKVG